MNTEVFDVIVAGGAMVGASLGLALSRQGKRVACVDPVELPGSLDDLSQFDQRATACSQTSINVFRHLGLWPMLKDYAAPIEHITVSKQGQWGRSRIAAADITQTAFGYVIPNDAIAVALRQGWQTQQKSGDVENNSLQGFWGRRVENVTLTDSHIVAALSDGQSITARLLVVADGARSAVRQGLGVASKTLDVQQMALVCNVACESPKQAEAFERFTSTGPLALLPLPSLHADAAGAAHYNLVWCGNAEQTFLREGLSSSEFSLALNQAFGASLGRFTNIGRRQIFPLSITTADVLTAPRTVVLGNAAQALHPVAGQGFNLGLRDVATLFDVLEQADDCGVNRVTDAYAKQRQHDRAEILGITTALAQRTVFKSDGLAASVFGLGLAAFDQLPVAKQTLATRASGFQVGLPSLCKPLAVNHHKETICA